MRVKAIYNSFLGFLKTKDLSPFEVCWWILNETRRSFENRQAGIMTNKSLQTVLSLTVLVRASNNLHKWTLATVKTESVVCVQVHQSKYTEKLVFLTVYILHSGMSFFKQGSPTPATRGKDTIWEGTSFSYGDCVINGEGGCHCLRGGFIVSCSGNVTIWEGSSLSNADCSHQGECHRPRGGFNV